MCCEHLVCASCAGPVAEARCPVCRVSRAQVHVSGAGHPVAAMAIIVAILVALAVVLQLTTGH